MRRYVGPALIVIGVVHLVYFAVHWSDRYAGIARAGVVNTVDGDDAREAAFWTLWFGVLVLTVGQLLRWIEARLGTVPAFPGWMLLVIGVGGGVLMPLSPFWLVVPLGLALLRSPRRTESGRPGGA